MRQETKQPAGGETRRGFIQKTAAAAAAVAVTNIFKTPVYGQNQAPSTGRVIGANDRIVVGFVGVGGQGMAHVRSMMDNAPDNNIAGGAVCDVWQKRIEGSKEFIKTHKNFAGGEVATYDDHRKLLEQKDIDVVCVSTVDHWHTQISIDAMNAGKHVYVEKPMTRYLDEAFLIYDTVKKTGKKLQVGSQGCTDQKWHVAANMIKAGKIGQLVMAQGSYPRNSPKGEWNYPIDNDAKQGLNWERWMGPVKKKVPLDVDHYFRWRKYYPYCAGLLGDLFPHRLHPYMLATGNPEFPTRVVAIGTKSIHTDKKTPGTYDRDVPEHMELLAEFPSGLTLVMISSTVCEHGLVEQINGHKGTLYLSGNRVQLDPERVHAEEVDPEKTEGIKPGEEVLNWHEKNWFESIRMNKEPNANIDLAVKVQTVISLGEMSDRMRISCNFDEKTRKITTGDGKLMKTQEVKALTYGSTDLS